MADYEKYIYALRKCAKEHESERTSYGQIIVSDLCRDTANLLEELKREPTTEEIKAEIEKQEKWLLQAGYNSYNVDIAFSTIKSLLAGSEGITTCENCIYSIYCIMYDPKMKRCKDYTESEV